MPSEDHVEFDSTQSDGFFPRIRSDWLPFDAAVLWLATPEVPVEVVQVSRSQPSWHNTDVRDSAT